MSQHKNEFGQPIGEPVADWKGVDYPRREAMEGRVCRLESLEVERHLEDLYSAFDGDDELWTYMAVGPFPSIDAFSDWMQPTSKADDPLFYALIDKASGKALGMAAYMRIKPQAGAIEVGSISFSRQLQKTVIATEAMYLMMQQVFDVFGYRRYEWKCDSLNAASRKAAERFGFHFEGIFKQALVYKGRNRDTAWFAILDSEWPAIKQAYDKWLSEENFDKYGQQKQKLQDLITAARK